MSVHSKSPNERGWEILRGSVIEGFLDMKKPLDGLAYFREKTTGKKITPEAGVAAMCCAAAQCYLETLRNEDGDHAGAPSDGEPFKSMVFEIFDRMKNECPESIDFYESSGHPNSYRMALSKLKVAEFTRDHELAVKVLLGSNFSSSDGAKMSDPDYVAKKALAVASVMRASRGNPSALNAAELVIEQVCKGPERVSVKRSVLSLMICSGAAKEKYV